MRRLTWMWAVAVGAGACTDDLMNPGPQPTPETAQAEFVSADGVAGQASMDGDFDGPPAGLSEDGRAAAPDEARSVEEGDIYRLGADGLIYNLNTYRGLQILDVSDPSAPRTVGQARLYGAPVEMYQVDGHAVVLLNGVQAYYGQGTAARAHRYEGGLVLVFDVRDPKRPRRVGQAQVPGTIRTSRLTRSPRASALYVAASEGARTYVASFRWDGSSLRSQSEMDLGGWVQDIQATPEFLLVASHDHQAMREQGSHVTVVDISDPNGRMVQGATLQVQGRVQSKFNLDVRGRMLRVVSGNSWGDARNTNHAETFDISDLQAPRRLDHETFGPNEDLYATLFLEDRAFFVTYRRVDPFHAFSIGDDGNLTERSEFVVSGWNDFFFDVMNQRRLIGIGTNDERGQTKAVSLYDITDLDEPNPLLVRKEVALEYSWSEASWDDRAVSVLEDAVRVEAPDGTVETGLVLLPFQGWDDTREQYVTAVQLFTFSADTLTLRGVMEHDSPVRRSFLVEQSTAVNLSEGSLSIYDSQDPDDPGLLGQLRLAPWVRDFLPLSERYGLRVISGRGWSFHHGLDSSSDRVEVVSMEADVENGPAVAEMEVPAGSYLFLEGAELRVVSAHQVDGQSQPSTQIQIFDLSDPTRPQEVGRLQSPSLPLGPMYGWDSGPYRLACDGPGCGFGGWWEQAEPNVLSTDEALVFIEPLSASEVVGTYHTTSRYPRDSGEGCWGPSGPQACTYFAGHQFCSQLEGLDGHRSPAMCSGNIFQCTQDRDGRSECTEVDPESVPLQIHRHSHEAVRRWQHHNLHVVDLSEPKAPRRGSTWSLPRSDEAVTVLAGEDRLYLNTRRPFRVPNDPRPYVKYHVQEFRLKTPAAARLGPKVNVPGRLLAVDGDRAVTQDFLWGANLVESSVNQVRLQGARAVLEGVQRFEDRYVDAVVLDGAGLALVGHRPATSGSGGLVVVPGVSEWRGWGQPSGTTQLSILDMRAGLRRIADVEMDGWAQLEDAVHGRALFRVPGGMLVVNTAFPTAPFAQAFYPLQGWPTGIRSTDGDTFVAAGPYGLYRMDLDTFNLLPL